jgi:hypothetical protein
MWIRDQVEGFLGGRVGGHYYCRCRGIGAVGQVCVVHQGDVREEIRAGSKMKLEKMLASACRQQKDRTERRAYESGILKALGDF